MIASCLAHRAGGHALAAYLHGVRIDELELTGITLWFPNGISRRAELLSELAVGLTGIAAVSRYRFGWHDTAATVVTRRFCQSELEDFREVHAIVGELAPLGDDDVLFESWTQALDLVGSPTWWRAIERIGVSVVRGAVSGSEVREIIEDVAAADGQQVIFPATGGLDW
jgi:hypothetical protein